MLSIFSLSKVRSLHSLYIFVLKQGKSPIVTEAVVAVIIW